MVTSLLIQNPSLPSPVIFKGRGYNISIPARAVDFACQIPSETATEDIELLLCIAPSLQITITGQGAGIPGPNIGEYTPTVLDDSGYRGVWDASTGIAPHFDPEAGWYWLISTSGQCDLDGISGWYAGEHIKWTGTKWMRVITASGTGVDGHTPIKGVDYFDGATGSDLPYDATAWDGDTDVPTKNVIRDMFESMAGLKWKGSWDAQSTYSANDAVEYNGSAYIANSAISPDGLSPDSNSSWDLWVASGPAGTVSLDMDFGALITDIDFGST